MNIKTVAYVTIATLSGVWAGSSSAAVINSIGDIANGITIDFENGVNAQNPNTVLNDFNMMASQIDSLGPILTQFTFPVLGNIDAPISGGALGGIARIETTDSPWSTIGISGVTSILTVDGMLTLTAFDILGNEIESSSLLFDAPDTVDFDAYNDAAVFLGIQSDVPIYAIELTADLFGAHANGNVGWDNLTYVSTVPIPAAGWLMFSGLVTLLVSSGRGSNR